MEIFRHVYQIASLVADRNLFQYLFLGDNTVLLDTGASYTPSETISPFLKQMGIAPSGSRSQSIPTPMPIITAATRHLSRWPVR